MSPKQQITIHINGLDYEFKRTINASQNGAVSYSAKDHIQEKTPANILHVTQRENGWEFANTDLDENFIQTVVRSLNENERR